MDAPTPAAPPSPARELRYAAGGAGRPHRWSVSRIGAADRRDAEVGELRAHPAVVEVVAEEDVRGLDVAVDDAAVVRTRVPRRCRRRVGATWRAGSGPSSRRPRRSRPPRLHDVVDARRAHQEFGRPRHPAGSRHPGCAKVASRLTSASCRLNTSVTRSRCAEHLHRDVAAQVRIPGAVHGREAAFADQGPELIPAP